MKTLGYKVPNGLVTNEVKRIRTEVVVSYFEVMYRNLKGPRKKPQKIVRITDLGTKI